MFDPETQRLASAVLDAAPTGFLLTRVDNGRIAHVNRAMLRMFGYAREQVVGQEIEFLLPARYRQQHWLLRGEYCKAPVTRSMGAGRNLFALHADGHEFPVEIGLNALELPEGTRILASVVDISERVRLESAFQKIVEASPDGVLIVDESSRVVMANPRLESIFGYGKDEMLGMELARLIPSRYLSGHEQFVAAYRAQPEVRSMGLGRDLTALRKDGKEFPVEIGLSPVIWQGAPMTMVAVSDITVRKKMEMDLRQANSDLEEFMHVASHDLKAPLNNIAGLTEWALEDLGEAAPESVRTNLERIHTQVVRIGSLLGDLLAYARAGKTAAKLELVDPREVLDNILQMQPLPEGFRLTAEIDIPPFEAVRTPLETVLRNLISNAVKHHDCGRGEIEVHARAEGSYCRFTVVDDGPGIPESAHKRIFQIFQTLSPNPKAGSFGMGLAVAKRMVEAHGGRIEVQSRDGQRGTTFVVKWPRFARKDLEA